MTTTIGNTEYKIRISEEAGYRSTCWKCGKERNDDQCCEECLKI